MKAVIFVLLVLLSTSALGQELQTGWAWAGIASITLGKSPTPAPAPAPSPKPGDPCVNCNGTGRVGDGKVSQTCRDCNGTGKTIAQMVSELQQRAADVYLSPVEVPAATPSRFVDVQQCPGGVCPLPASKSSVYVSPQATTVRKGWFFKR
jgi:hypothetical protein